MADEKQFLTALAAVRPGLPVQALRQITGARWCEPLAHAQGRVVCIEHSHSFAAQVDQDGIVRRVQFGRPWSDPAFSSEVEILGLRIGMSLASVRRLRPDLTISIGTHPMPTGGSAKLDAHTTLRLQFLFEQLRVIEFVDDRAVYPVARATPFPDAKGPPGGPFRDPNFKLVVMNDLLDRRLIDLGRLGELAEFVLKRPFNVEKEGHRLLRPVYDYLVRFPLSQSHLDAIETIVFDGGNSIYFHIWPFWDGGSNEFDVQHIEGIELCRNVREIHVMSMLNETDFSRLALLKKLETRTGFPEES